jgi:adenylate cyclase
MADRKSIAASEDLAESSSSGFPSSIVKAQMERILNSPEFKATDAQRAFLRYVVEKTLAGHADAIKGYTVATEVFGRHEDFDQATDPIVSIQANKLRRALERYYLVGGQNDPVRIEIPKGSYVPLFQKQAPSPRNDRLHLRRKTDPSCTHPWPTILVQSFENLTGNRDLEYMGMGSQPKLRWKSRATRKSVC